MKDREVQVWPEAERGWAVLWLEENSPLVAMMIEFYRVLLTLVTVTVWGGCSCLSEEDRS